MEPTLLPKNESRNFRSEAEYRLWQSELAALDRAVERRGLASRIADKIRDWLAQDLTRTERKLAMRSRIKRADQRP